MPATLLRVALAAACCAPTLGHFIGSPQAPALIDVFTAGTESYACYRIPALIALPNGTLLLFAEGRRHSCADHGAVDLVLKSSHDAGATWSALRLVRSESTPSANVTIGNPAPVALGGSRVLLPFCRNNLQGGALFSADGGATWAERAPLPVAPSWTWVATGPPGSLLLPSGRVLVPANRILGGKDAVLVFATDDEGLTWAPAPSAVVFGGNEVQAAPLPWVSPAAVLLSMRNADGGGSRLAAQSSDGGATWSAPWTTIEETACEASTLALPGHAAGPRLVMSSAFSSTRVNLTLHTSSDSGRHWAPAVQVYEGSSAYSTLAPVAASPSAVCLAFERDGYGKISFVQRIDV
jgi:sialidase-1